MKIVEHAIGRPAISGHVKFGEVEATWNIVNGKIIIQGETLATLTDSEWAEAHEFVRERWPHLVPQFDTETQ